MEQVVGELDQDRARPAVADLRERAAHRVRHGLDQDHLFRPLGDVLVVEQRAEVRRDVEQAPGIPAGQHHDRDGVAERLGHAAERVLRARPMLHRENADPLARADAADRVGHVQPGALLPHDDRADVGLGRRLDDGIDRVADQEVHAFALEDFRHYSRCSHLASLDRTRPTGMVRHPRENVLLRRYQVAGW